MKKLSIYTTQGMGSFEERIRTIKNAGFDGVFFDWERNVDRSGEIRKALKESRARNS